MVNIKILHVHIIQVLIDEHIYVVFSIVDTKILQVDTKSYLLYQTFSAMSTPYIPVWSFTLPYGKHYVDNPMYIIDILRSIYSSIQYNIVQYVEVFLTSRTMQTIPCTYNRHTSKYIYTVYIVRRSVSHLTQSGVSFPGEPLEQLFLCGGLVRHSLVPAL